MKYIIDSNVFIEAHRGMLPVDVAISFWNKIKELGVENKIFSLDKVKDEIFKNTDDLKQWMKQSLRKDFFLQTTSEILDKIQDIVLWTTNNNFYTKKAKEIFLRMDTADIYLVAFGIFDTDTTIVTRETTKLTNSKDVLGKISIPDVCKHFNIRCIQPAQMFRELGETF